MQKNNSTAMKEECVIVGGGVAGLCAAIRLTELGIAPLIIEAGTYPSHKVCGEFFSPESLKTLNEWNIYPTKIEQSRLHIASEVMEFSFPTPAGSLSHMTFDPLLLKRATEGGARLLTEIKVVRMVQNFDSHSIHLSNGAIVDTSKLIIAAGKYSQFQMTSPKFNYMGFKSHFDDIPIKKNTLEMFFFKGAYVGISPIEDNKFNVACLMDSHFANQFETSQECITSLMSQNKLFHFYLSQGKSLFPNWMSAAVPNFGIKTTPDWPQTYFIGDAAGTIPPASGDGLSIAIRSGILAAEYVKKNDAIGFKKAWKNIFARPIQNSKIFNHICLRPQLSIPLARVCIKLPYLTQKIFQATRFKG